MSFRTIVVLALFAASSQAQELPQARPSGIHVQSAPAETVNFSQLANAQQQSPELSVSEFRMVDRPRRTPRVHLKPEVLQQLHPQGQLQVSSPLFSAFDTTVLQQAPRTLSPAPTTNFLGLNDNNVTIPPDTDGAVGPHHIVTALNSEIRITDRAGTEISKMLLSTFMGSTKISDPHVLYDFSADRWFLVVVINPETATSGIKLMVSQTGDPTGAWKGYIVDADSTDTFWADYPTVGFNKDWIVVTTNMFPIDSNSDAFPGSDVFVFDKANLYAGNDVAKVTMFSDPAYTDVPAVTYDSALSTMYLVANYGDQEYVIGDQDNVVYALRISSITGPVGHETFDQSDDTGPFVIVNALGDYEGPNNGDDFAPQSMSTLKIQANDGRINNVVYRNGALWFTHTTFLPDLAPSRASVQWYEVFPNGDVGQLGRIDDPATGFFYTYPSIAVNSQNDVLIGYSRMSANQFASAAYSVRQAQDPVSTLQDAQQYKNGLAVYSKTFSSSENRWGDYSTAQVDPVNDLDFWTLQEFAAAQNSLSQSLWGTWWAQVSMSPAQGLLINPGALGFGYEFLNTRTPADPIKITNTSGVSATFNGVSFTGDFASVNNNCVGTLASGAACTLSVAFKPGGSGFRSGSLVIDSTLAGASQGTLTTIPLGGTGFDIVLSLVRPSRPARGTALVASSANLSLAAGESALLPLTFNTTGGYNGPIYFTCSNLPRNVRCELPEQVVAHPDAAQVNVRLTAAPARRAARLQGSQSAVASRLEGASSAQLFTISVNASLDGIHTVRSIPVTVAVR